MSHTFDLQLLKLVMFTPGSYFVKFHCVNDQGPTLIFRTDVCTQLTSTPNFQLHQFKVPMTTALTMEVFQVSHPTVNCVGWNCVPISSTLVSQEFPFYALPHTTHTIVGSIHVQVAPANTGWTAYTSSFKDGVQKVKKAIQWKDLEKGKPEDFLSSKKLFNFHVLHIEDLMDWKYQTLWLSLVYQGTVLCTSDPLFVPASE
ncbi:hypothetical protein HMI56_001020 [Coelomomyces lativittatus]|nr:hypothetical protein HMI56_001020 [Coelomomyces lativittatus]